MSKSIAYGFSMHTTSCLANSLRRASWNRRNITFVDCKVTNSKDPRLPQLHEPPLSRGPFINCPSKQAQLGGLLHTSISFSPCEAKPCPYPYFIASPNLQYPNATPSWLLLPLAPPDDNSGSTTSLSSQYPWLIPPWHGPGQNTSLTSNSFLPIPYAWVVLPWAESSKQLVLWTHQARSKRTKPPELSPPSQTLSPSDTQESSKQKPRGGGPSPIKTKWFLCCSK